MRQRGSGNPVALLLNEMASAFDAQRLRQARSASRALPHYSLKSPAKAAAKTAGFTYLRNAAFT